MILTIFLWLMIWGGMFTGLYNVTDQMFSDILSAIQGLRAFLPLVALYICIMWMFLARIKPPSFSAPIGLFFYYCMIGIFVSFLSPEKKTALYWGFLYLSPLLFIWIISFMEEAMERLRAVLYINYAVSIFLMFSLIPEVIKKASGALGITAFYELPFNLGQMTKNGVGRFALVVVIISFARILCGKKINRYMWFIALAPAMYLLLQTQSRTALLGLAVASVLFVLIKGLKWQFAFAGPLVAYAIWMSGYQLRAKAEFAQLIGLTGREYTWQQALIQVKKSPLLGWGFHADRIMLDFQHMHNSYLHALIHSGIIGTLFFIGGFVSIWYVILKNNLFQKIKDAEDKDYVMLVESILLVGALTARSFFESTAAFYGVDLLLFIPAVAYIYVWTKKESIEVL
jgi:O-antigen ligase